MAIISCRRFDEAHKICVALTATHADQDDQDDPALHNARYALLRGSTEKARKCQAIADVDAYLDLLPLHPRRGCEAA
jgi:hypothetical protein